MAVTGASFVVSVGRYGGFYWRRAYCIRLCLGWIAFTFLPFDFDDLAAAVAHGGPRNSQGARPGRPGAPTTPERRVRRDE